MASEKPHVAGRVLGDLRRQPIGMPAPTCTYLEQAASSSDEFIERATRADAGARCWSVLLFDTQRC